MRGALLAVIQMPTVVEKEECLLKSGIGEERIIYSNFN
jgi:hypothetical protein